VVLLIILIIPVAASLLNRSAALLRVAALLSAAAAMPDAGLELLGEGFRVGLYTVAEPPAPEQEVMPEEYPETAQPMPPQAAAPPQGSSSGTEAPGTAGESQNPKPADIPGIPEAYAAPVISENFAGKEGGTLIRYEAGYIKNDTKYSNGEVEEILEKRLNLRLSADSSPQVLIMHTHATESFEQYDHNLYDIRNTWRSTDNHGNMVAVGDAMRKALESHGIGVLHDSTQHDYPSYNGSYERSAETVSAYLEEYPSIKIVLDVHRDAMARGDSIVKPVALVNGQKAAQIMIISGCDDGTMNMPGWRENLRFAAAFQSYMEQTAPGLTRPVYLAYRKYNQDLTAGSLLLEFGSNANTLEEASYSAELAGHALAGLISDFSEPAA
jgi:stage II sporulation protein P